MTFIYEPSEDSYFLEEILEKEISPLLEDNTNLKFLEIGCGSGIQLKAALKYGIKKENILGVDINEEAVNHCKQLGFNVLISNLFKNVNEKYGLIIFNPPYLPKQGGEDNESQLATTGGEKGSEIINEFLKQAKSHLITNGKIILLISSLTNEIDWLDYKKELIKEKKLFFEELFIWRLRA